MFSYPTTTRGFLRYLYLARERNQNSNPNPGNMCVFLFYFTYILHRTSPCRALEFETALVLQLILYTTLPTFKGKEYIVVQSD